MSHLNSPYSAGTAPELVDGLDADTLNDCDVIKNDVTSSDSYIPSHGALKSYMDDEIADHADEHTAMFYDKTYIDSEVSRLHDLAFYQNYIINGDMEITQRNLCFDTTGLYGLYSLDRWQIVDFNDGSAYIEQSSDVPAGTIFTKSLMWTPSVIEGGITLCGISQAIEAKTFGYLEGHDTVLSFWVKSSNPGIHCVSSTTSNGFFRVSEYTINVADTWELKEIQIPFDHSTNDFPEWTSIMFVLYCDAEYCGPKDAWLEEIQVFATSNQVNEFHDVDDNFYITGVSLTKGTIATSFKLAGENYLGELKLCKRYYETSYPYGERPGTDPHGEDEEYGVKIGLGTDRFYDPKIKFSTPKRSTSYTMSFYNPLGDLGYIREIGSAYIPFGDAECFYKTEAGCNIMKSGSITEGESYSFFWVCECEY